jgi:hypothetical protein
MIYIQLNDATFAPGETVQGSCQWMPSGDEGGKKAKLWVGWRTEGRGDVDREALYERDLEAGATERFSCQLPDTAPLSYDGQLIRIIWEVAVDLSGRFGTGKAREAKVFRVVAPQDC